MQPGDMACSGGGRNPPMVRNPDSDAAWHASPPSRVGVLAFAGLLFALLSVVQLWERDPDLPVFLYTLPVVVVALEFGIAAGLGAAALALGLDVSWTLVKEADMSVVGVASRAAAFALLGGVVGYLAQSLAAASTRLRAVLDTMVDPFAVYRAERDGGGAIVDFRCAYANDAAGALVRPSRRRMVGARLGDLSPGYRERPTFERHRRLVESGDPLELEESFDGHVFEVRAVRLEDGFAAVSRDVTERTHTEERLRDAGAELERSNAALAEFAHVVSHELCQPLATASLFAETLGSRNGSRNGDAHRRATDDPVLVEHLREVLDEMQNRIQALLTFAEVHAAPAPHEPLDCNALVRGVLGTLEASVAATGAAIRVGPLPTVVGDGDQLTLLFENLLSNAMRFGSNGTPPEVEVSAARENGGWRFTVADRGAGVAPRDAARIFDLFGRASGETRPGTGIGLAVCKTVVELHGGRIWVEPRSGAGSAFQFTLR